MGGWHYFSRGDCKPIDESKEFRFMNVEADDTGDTSDQ